MISGKTSKGSIWTYNVNNFLRTLLQTYLSVMKRSVALLGKFISLPILSRCTCTKTVSPCLKCSPIFELFESTNPLESSMTLTKTDMECSSANYC